MHRGRVPGFGGEDDESLSAAVGTGPRIAVEYEVADDAVAVVLGAETGAVDLVAGPPDAKVVVLQREFTDKHSELGVVGVAGGFHT
jgi:hypothetical protein